MTTRTQEQKEVSTQAKLLARYLAERGLATLTHSQALEAIAQSRNVSAFNVLAAQLKGDAGAKPSPEADVAASASRRETALAQLKAAIADGLTFGEAVNVFAETRTELELRYARAADTHATQEGELEVDDNAIVSLGEDRGAYVMAWVWVPRDQLEIPENPAAAFGLGFGQIELTAGALDLDLAVAPEDLDFNEAALGQYAKWRSRGLAPDTWLVRTTDRVATPFTLTVADFDTLNRSITGKAIFQGTLGGSALRLEFCEKD